MLDKEKANQILMDAECIYNDDQVSMALDSIADNIRKKYCDKNPLVFCVMKGGAFTACALLQRLQFPLEFDFMQVTRYRNTAQGGDVEWRVKPDVSIAGRFVLIVDDILDEGITLQEIVNYCQSEKAASVEVAVLTDKKHNRNKNRIKADYVALTIPDCYVVGCGMDYKGYFRNMNGVYAIKNVE